MRLSPNRRAVLAMAASVLVLPSASLADEPKAADPVFVGYVFGRTGGIDYRLYTHLCHAFLVADGEGRIKTTASVPSRELTARAHEKGVKVLISLGGWGWDEQFAAIVAKPEAEDRFARDVLALVDQADYDGIDFDWEYPDTREEVAGFERLCRRFRKELDALGLKKNRKMVLTMAASANPGTLRWLDRAFLLETMDWVNVMTYDFTGGWTDFAGHHSPLFASSKAPKGPARSTEATMRFLVEERKIPADRLAVGIPLYGRGFPVSEPYASTKGAPKGRLPGGDYANLARLLKEGGWRREWDAETKNPWLIAADHSKVIGYDDEESVAIKARWARENGFRGVFFWQVAGDRLPDGSHPLQESAKKAWGGAAPR